MCPHEPLPTGDGRDPPDPSTVGAGLDRLLRRLGSSSATTVGALATRWEELVGPQLVRHTEPVGVQRGVLVVAVDDPAWASELRWLGDELARRARTLLNDDSIERIEVRVRRGR